MNKDKMNPKVDEFISNTKKWREEFKRLRNIILDWQLTEELQWGVPCYTIEKSIVVLIHGFKEYCAILFVKGAFLSDKARETDSYQPLSSVSAQ